MTSKTRVEPYRWLAEHYDEVFSSARGPIVAARNELLRDVLATVRTACDLACGTGTTAVALARRGISMYAVDLSPSMCRLTREKARRAGLGVRVLQADLRNFRLPEAVDLITCEGDALNHLPRKTDLRLVVRAAARALCPGGHFYFDVNNRLGFERYWTGNVWLERPGVAVLMRNGNDAKAGRAWSDVEWFIREGRLWRRQRERVEEVCWDAAGIRLALQSAGFDRVRAWDAAPFFKDAWPIGRGCRSIYLARRARPKIRPVLD